MQQTFQKEVKTIQPKIPEISNTKMFGISMLSWVRELGDKNLWEETLPFPPLCGLPDVF